MGPALLSWSRRLDRNSSNEALIDYINYKPVVTVARPPTAGLCFIIASSHLARSFLLSLESGENVADEFLIHAFRLKQARQVNDSEFLPDEIWEHAGLTFD
jgi:hypothetical protein